MNERASGYPDAEVKQEGKDDGAYERKYFDRLLFLFRKTRRIAEMLQKQTGGRLSRIYPRQPYPADFERLLTQVKEEVRSGDLQKIIQEWLKQNFAEK